MTPVGREPAEDVKRRLVVACEEASLTVNKAVARPLPASHQGFVVVEASPSDWPHKVSMLTVTAIVSATGAWSEAVTVSCVSAHPDGAHRLDGPFMEGRGAVPLSELVGELRETVNEREQVIAAIRAGMPGPYRFKRSGWPSPNNRCP